MPTARAAADVASVPGSSRAPRSVAPFARSPRALVLSLCALALPAIAWVDLHVGREISFSLFYLFPVALAAWVGGIRIGLSFAVAGAALWGISDQWSIDNRANTHWMVPYWNSLVRLAYFAIVARLVALVRQLLERERKAADGDFLTGVFNRAGWFEAVEVELARARRHGLPMSVAYIDLDDFKQINDGAGHAAGDRILQATAEALRYAVRRSDVVGRLGGDEFVILLPEAPPDMAERLCAKVHEALGAVRHDGRPVQYSIGVAAFETPPERVQDLVTPADAAMYQAKRAGKNRLVRAST